MARDELKGMRKTDGKRSNSSIKLKLETRMAMRMKE